VETTVTNGALTEEVTRLRELVLDLGDARAAATAQIGETRAQVEALGTGLALAVAFARGESLELPEAYRLAMAAQGRRRDMHLGASGWRPAMSGPDGEVQYFEVVTPPGPYKPLVPDLIGCEIIVGQAFADAVAWRRALGFGDTGQIG
jgi:hypothetical protein